MLRWFHANRRMRGISIKNGRVLSIAVWTIVVLLTWPLILYLASIFVLSMGGLVASITTGCMPVVFYETVPRIPHNVPIYRTVYKPVYAVVDDVIIGQQKAWEYHFAPSCQKIWGGGTR